MWEKESEDLVMDLFNKNNDDLYLIDMDLINELNKIDWKYLQIDLEYDIIVICEYLFQLKVNDWMGR